MGFFPATRPDHASSETISDTGDVAMSAIETSLAALKEASAFAGKIPYISPVAGLLLQALTMRDASGFLLPCEGSSILLLRPTGGETVRGRLDGCDGQSQEGRRSGVQHWSVVQEI
jgi:hypothetical protein